ncbi:MAG: Protein of unknown function (DUF1553)/Protein of unknown function [Planctomycetota bacterium]|nr:Protein of unknown function (DUF1553)/Protein of unknown function [Planctomycetota bacterium]
MRTPLHALLGIVILATGARATPADELLPADRPIEAAVDHYVDAKLTKEGVHAAADADDATLVRRLTLDLQGRIPTDAEVRAFVLSTEADKRARLVDRLMASPGFVRHQVDTTDAMLMAGSRGSLNDYLSRAVRENRPWDQVFREVMQGNDSDPARKGSSDFLKARARDTDRLTSDVSSVFFGVNISCAKCHDHPKVRDWKQEHYYGMKSFLDRTFDSDNFVAERDFGAVKFKTTEGEERKARFMFLTGRVVDVPGIEEPSKEAKQEEKKRLEEARKKKEPPAPPKFSARGKLVEIALEPTERAFFAKAIVNRLWNRVFGVGLVMPLDQMHSENPPSHPELLQWLARDTIDHQYDLHRLIRGLVLSRAYARTSRWESAERPDPRLFATASVRPLTPFQLAASMWVASTDPASLPEVAKRDELDRKLEEFAGRGRSLASTIARPGEDYQIGASEALLMSNSDRLKDMLADGGDRLVARMAKMSDRREKIELAVRNVLSRAPDEEEISLFGEYLARYEDRPAEGCRQLVWALLTSAEFRFNY